MSALTAVAVLTTGWAIAHPAALTAYIIGTLLTAGAATVSLIDEKPDPGAARHWEEFTDAEQWRDPGPMTIPLRQVLHHQLPITSAGAGSGRLAPVQPPAGTSPLPAGDAPGPGSAPCPGTDGLPLAVHAPGPGAHAATGGQ